jgi:hypothetical protein
MGLLPSFLLMWGTKFLLRDAGESLSSSVDAFIATIPRKSLNASDKANEKHGPTSSSSAGSKNNQKLDAQTNLSPRDIQDGSDESEETEAFRVAKNFVINVLDFVCERHVKALSSMVCMSDQNRPYMQTIAAADEEGQSRRIQGFLVEQHQQQTQREEACEARALGVHLELEKHQQEVGTHRLSLGKYLREGIDDRPDSNEILPFDSCHVPFVEGMEEDEILERQLEDQKESGLYSAFSLSSSEATFVSAWAEAPELLKL